MLEYEARIPKYVESRNDVLWRYRRYAYYLGHVALCFAISFWIGPNLILLSRYPDATPATFAQVAQARYAGVVAAIKAYQRDKGTLPLSVWEMPKAYFPAGYEYDGADLCGTTRISFPSSKPHGVLVYEFKLPGEGWYVYSPRYDGPIPAPIVPPGPATQPTSTRPMNSGE